MCDPQGSSNVVEIDADQAPTRPPNPLERLARKVLIGMVWAYQVTLGPFLGGHCRFVPSCSNYFIEAVKKHGALRGGWKGVCRVLRCHPFRPGGYDPP